MKNESKETRELKFECPKCGSNRLRVEASGWLAIDSVDDNGGMTWGPMEPEELGVYCCGECGYELEFEDEYNGDIVLWLMEHCDPETSEPGDPVKHKSQPSPEDEN
jgi:hypothetical protein